MWKLEAGWLCPPVFICFFLVLVSGMEPAVPGELMSAVPAGLHGNQARQLCGTTLI